MISDHIPVLFQVGFSCAPVKLVRLLRFLTISLSQFSVVFLPILNFHSYGGPQFLVPFLLPNHPGLCVSIKTKQPKANPEPWFSDRTCAAKQVEGQAAGVIPIPKGLLASFPEHC